MEKQTLKKQINMRATDYGKRDSKSSPKLDEDSYYLSDCRDEGFSIIGDNDFLSTIMDNTQRPQSMVQNWSSKIVESKEDRDFLMDDEFALP